MSRSTLKTLGTAPRFEAPVVICRSPSRRGTKGTGVIEEVVRSLSAVRTYAAEKTARYAPNLASVAGALGMPKAFAASSNGDAQ